MDPRQWGPIYWERIHDMAAGYPDQPTPCDRTRYLAFFVSFVDLLPCEECSSSYKDLLAGSLALTPEDLGSKAKLFDWTVRLHNAVNQKLGKLPFSTRVAFETYRVR